MADSGGAEQEYAVVLIAVRGILRKDQLIAHIHFELRCDLLNHFCGFDIVAGRNQDLGRMVVRQNEIARVVQQCGSNATFVGVPTARTSSCSTVMEASSEITRSVSFRSDAASASA